MTIDELERLVTFFDEIDSEFYFTYSDYQNANKKDKIRAERNLRQIIDRADSKVQRNTEIYNLYTGGENATAYDRACVYEDFRNFGSFRKNISEIQAILKEEIKKLS